MQVLQQHLDEIALDRPLSATRKAMPNGFDKLSGKDKNEAYTRLFE
jgi:hypothetical protein